jgi:REP element-mobilizing transposase RayT
MIKYPENYYRNLPHFFPNGERFFITTSLKGSIPQEIIIQLKTESEAVKKRIKLECQNNSILYNLELANAQKRYFGYIDKHLDNYNGGFHWLKQPEIAQIIMDAFHYQNGKNYDLLAFTIMSNHFHLLFDTANYDVHPTNIMSPMKRFTSRQSNILLNRTGIPFWQEESHDRFVRDDDELFRIINYILQNPVKANIVSQWKDYTYTWLKPEFEAMFP